ncbi:conserved unknown protein [Ectocarpus siliculosus]|uniref:Large ribosomal subunit protein mL45 n=1 Tax=Ectocarpus siliculosus TaxID=2880 RepID=D7FKT9_ECTSI|nr:conserved unknown protein [Ectocarpus siliculosus]|eukprot:CBJ29484.1 conserved unknown protein [Ectocarpus siliculosus]
MRVVGIIRRGISSSSSRLGEVRSSGGIFDPYVYRGAGGKGLPPMMSSEGVRERLGIMRSHLKSGVCAGIIQKHVPDFHVSKFPPVANQIFKDFFEAHRKGDTRALAGLTTEELYASLKGEIKSSKSRGAQRAAFRLVDFKEPTTVLQMRVDRKKHISPKEGWGQVTCRLCSERQLLVVDAKGNEVEAKADEDATTAQNVTVGVFEAFFGDSAGRWRLALVQEFAEAPAGATSATGKTKKSPQAQAQ